jgi:RNA polymerase sigma-70 factor (ECF subfamily)
LAAITSVDRASGFEAFELPVESGAAALYERHAGRVFGYCLSRLSQREDAEDAVQTTFLHAVRSLRRGVVPLVESAWLIGIARNVCRARWEAAGRESRLESVCDPVELDQGNADPRGRHDELIGLEEALTRLPEQQRRAVLLRDWRGLSYDEVAEQLGVSHAAVETLIFRGRRTLAELLREEPRATRRRLASLGNLGSLSTTAKTALTGAALAVGVLCVAAAAGR